MGKTRKLKEPLEHRLVRIRTELLLDEPFFGNLALRLQFKEDPSAKTFWVDGISLGYNPDFAAGLTDHEIKGVLCHEILHVAAGHPWRRKGRSPRRWNEACDYAINGLIVANRFVLPQGVLLDPKYTGKSAEAVYACLKQEQEQKQEAKSGSAEQGKPQGDNTPEGQESGEGKNPAGDSPPKSAGPSGDDDPNGQASGKGNQGSQDPASGGADGEPSCSPTGEVRDCPGEASARAETEEQWRQATATAAKVARNRGRLPGSLETFVGEALKPKVDWRETLRRFVQQAHASQDYSWQRPHRSFISHGLYMPSLQGDRIPCIIAAVDTSGSCLYLVKEFAAELRSLQEDVNPVEMHVVTCDARVTGTYRLHEGEDLPAKFKGGGGTAFTPVFDQLEAEGIRPTCLIYLTDTQGMFPSQEPEYPVLWVHPPGQAHAPWGELVELQDR